MQIVVSKLEKEIHAGDWHDAPLRWRVAGPDNELQLFSTKKDAMRYKSIRKRATSFDEAGREYAKG